MSSLLSRAVVEPVGGVTGDMLLGALIDAGADVTAIRCALESLGLTGLVLHTEVVQVEGERALHVRSLAPSSSQEHHHHHHHLSDILELIERAEASPTARRRAQRIFGILGEAEARVHGGTPDTVHLHEVGELDSVLDVLGIAVALDTLGNPSVHSLPLPSGQGTVHTAHGELTCPVPAVVAIAETFSVPMVSVSLPGETITPTGIAALAEICEGWLSTKQGVDGDDAIAPENPRPLAKRGVGAGTRRFVGVPNVVRVHTWR